MLVRLRDRLGERLIQYIAEEFVDSPGLDSPGGLSPAGGDRPGEESIFDYGSTIGLLLDSDGDYWIRNVAALSWTSVIVVPRMEFYHPPVKGRKGRRPRVRYWRTWET